MNQLSTESFIFISYAHADQKIAKRLTADLQKHNIPFWIDHQDIHSGTPDWELTIRTAISKATALVLIASPQSRTSRVVKGELAVAEECKLPIYPFWVGGNSWIQAAPLGLISTQYIDAREYSYEEGFLKLLEILKIVSTRPDEIFPLQGTAYPNASHQDWGDAPDVPVFFGRSKELEKLEGWIIKDRCRLVAILGMRGIGKTRLSIRLGKGDPSRVTKSSKKTEKARNSIKLGKGGIGKTDLTITLARGIQEQFEYVIWRRLLNAPKLTTILADLIRVLSNQQDIILPENIEEQISRLLSYLRQHRCLLIFDNAETILEGGKRAGQYREGYEDYGKLFQQIAEVPHQSCLLLTSREKPQDIAQLEGPGHSVRSLELGGLDYENSKKIFNATEQFHREQYQYVEFHGTEEDWQSLTEFYDGNPLALELAAKHILNFYTGNIGVFLKEGQQIFSDLRDLLDWYFQRLDDLEKEVMYWLAINREPISITDLKNDILSYKAKSEIVTTLHLLQRLVPLDKSSDSFTLQPVLMEYMTDRIVEQATEDIEHLHIDVLNNYALIKALAKDYVRDMQVRLILHPVLQHFITHSNPDCEQMLKDLLKLLHEKPPDQPGYAAGNLLNGLIHINAELQSIDFSQLPVWQAYLRDVSLIDVNFSHADLTKSVFTDTFGSVLSVAFSPNGLLVAAGTNTGEIRIWKVSDGTPLYTFTGHTDWVWGLSFNSDSSLLVSGSSDQTVRLWDIANEQCIQILKGHAHRIRNVIFSRDDTMLASASEDMTIRIWDTHSGNLLHILIGHTNPVRAIAFTPDNTILASGSDDQTVRLWNIEKEQCIQVMHGHTSQIWSLALSSDGNILATGSDDRTVRTWDIHTGEALKVLRGHNNWICSLAFAPTSYTLASGSADGTVRLWNAQTGQPLNTLQGHKNWVNSVNFSPDGKTLASGSHDQTVRLWETSTGHCLMTLQGYSNWVRSLVFNPQGNLLSSGDRTVRLWNVQTGQRLATLQGHTTWVRALAFSTDGTLLASASDDQTARIWKVRTAQPIYELRGHTNRVKSLAFSPNGKLLVTGSDDHTVRLWDIQIGRHYRILRGHTNRIRSVAFNPNGILFASGSDDRNACIWNIRDDQPVHVLRGHTNRVWSIAFSPNGQFLATGSEDATIRIWNVDTGQCLQVLQGHMNSVWSIAFSPEGNMISSSSEDRTIRIWHVSTGQCIHILSGHTNPIWCIAFSPDSTLLASGSHDNTIRLWNTYSGTNLAILREHTEPIWAVNFSPDNKLLASCSDDGTCILWDVEQKHYKHILKSERPYERMNITAAKGLTASQQAILRALGAIQEEVELTL